MIKIEGPGAVAEIESTKFHGYIRFRAANLGPERLEAIRRAASLGFAMDVRVWTFSHNADCSNATELSLLK